MKCIYCGSDMQLGGIVTQGVPADEVELALPAAGTLSEDCDALNDLVFDFCHSALPAFALFATIIKEVRKDFNR